jgi:formylmethanofuran dehydrogenase subunit E
MGTQEGEPEGLPEVQIQVRLQKEEGGQKMSFRAREIIKGFEEQTTLMFKCWECGEWQMSPYLLAEAQEEKLVCFECAKKLTKNKELNSWGPMKGEQ